MTGWLIGAGIVYLLFFSGRRTAITSTAPATTTPAAVTTPGATQISIPGLGTYTNIGGGQSVGITLDGNLIGSFFG